MSSRGITTVINSIAPVNFGLREALSDTGDVEPDSLQSGVVQKQSPVKDTSRLCHTGIDRFKIQTLNSFVSFTVSFCQATVV